MAKLADVDWSTIPAPEDDGAARHLPGTRLPSVSLAATDGRPIDLSALEGTTVVYVYPMTGSPDRAMPDDWDMIPGARGCTPQACAFRDHFAELKAGGADHLFGLSAQAPDEQKEAAERLHLPFALLSDADLRFGEALRLPSFRSDGMTLLKRLTLIVRDGAIRHVFYPVFPPDRNAGDVIAWLKANPAE